MIYEKIYNVMNESPALEKSMTVGSGRNSYKAVSEKVILNAVKPLFKKYKLVIFPTDTEINEIVTTYEKAGYNGGSPESKTRMITQLKVTFKIVDIESGESIEVAGVGSGADPQDKGAGKAFTYALKSALSKTFMLFSGDDTDNTHSDDIDKPTKITKTQAKALETLIKNTNTDMGKILGYYKVNSLNDLNTEQFAEVSKRLDKKR